MAKFCIKNSMQSLGNRLSWLVLVTKDESRLKVMRAVKNAAGARYGACMIGAEWSIVESNSKTFVTVIAKVQYEETI